MVAVAADLVAGGPPAAGNRAIKRKTQMKDLARKFLSAEERKEIDAAVKAAEKETAGEIVCMVVSSSYHYPVANILGGASIALPTALLLTPAIGGLWWAGTQNLWLFLGIFGVMFAVFFTMVDNVARLKRWFISRREIEEEVEEAAMTNFFHHGLYRTRDATGILLFVSVFERKVWILADQGINEKVPAGQWDALVAEITQGIRDKRPGRAICAAIEKMGNILKTHFPIRPGDTDELPNVILDEKA